MLLPFFISYKRFVILQHRVVIDPSRPSELFFPTIASDTSKLIIYIYAILLITFTYQ